MFKKATVVNQQKLRCCSPPCALRRSRRDLLLCCLALQHTTPRRGSDVKRLKKDLQLALPALSDDDLDVAIPAKADVLMFKLSNRALVYAVDGRNPIAFDPVRPCALATRAPGNACCSIMVRSVATRACNRC
jgi:hypothetical protein